MSYVSELWLYILITSVKNSFRFFRKIFFAEDAGLSQKFEGFFSFFFAILSPKNFYH
jgi:hypothetical protein